MVNGASLPPTKNLFAIPDFNHATPFNIACKAVEQVIECEISGPSDCKSLATQDEILPKVVVGEAKVAVFPVLKNSEKCFSNNDVAPRDEPKLIPKLSPLCQPAFFMA